MADTIWRVYGARKGLDERSEPHTRLLYDLNEVRARSKAFRPEAIANHFNPLPFRYINIWGGVPGAMARRRNQPFMMPIALKAATFLAMPASSQLATTSSGFL